MSSNTNDFVEMMDLVGRPQFLDDLRKLFNRLPANPEPATKQQVMDGAQFHLDEAKYLLTLQKEELKEHPIRLAFGWLTGADKEFNSRNEAINSLNSQARSETATAAIMRH